MNDFTEIEKLLSIVKSKIEAHNEFKKEYDKQLAFDFSLFNFFNVGENKVSEILAYFLDEKQSHGQGNIFLNEFVIQFYGEEIDTTGSNIICEKVIDQNRRIDIYLEIGELIIAIENKIWADDQYNQLNDYATYLEKESKRNFLLLYLNPYGSEPTKRSIHPDFQKKLTEKEQFKVISYKFDIINLINKWLVICEADNVSYFIKEFKKYLEIKFLGNNTLNMSENLREIIYQNQAEVKSLVDEYQNMQREVIQKLDKVAEKLKNQPNTGLEISKVVLGWDEGCRIYKYPISKEGNKIWVQYVQDGICLYSYNFSEGIDEKKFIEKAKDRLNGINGKGEIDYKQSEDELVKLFINQVELVNEIFEEYETNKAS